MLCYPLEERRLLNKVRGCYWHWPVYVQPKLDGERCRAKDGNFLLSSEENIFKHLPHIQKSYQKLCIKSGFWPELDGELYAHHLTFEQIHSRVSTSRLSPHEDYQSIQFHIFDLAHENLMQELRFSLLNMLNIESPLVLVPTYQANSLPEIMEYFKKFTNLGYEGIIVREPSNHYVRRRSPYVLKFKPKKTDTYLIVDVLEEISLDGKPKDTFGSFVCQKDGQRFSTGSGTFTEVEKKKLWNDRFQLLGKFCKIWYQNITTKEKVPRFISKIQILELDDEPSFEGSAEPSTAFNPMLNFGEDE